MIMDEELQFGHHLEAWLVVSGQWGVQSVSLKVSYLQISVHEGEKMKELFKFWKISDR